MHEILENLLENFQEQDYENGFFDLIFHIDGKELFAHRAVLASASSVFKKQFLSSKSDDPINRCIQIFDYSYDEFYDFLYFIYLPYQDPQDKNFSDIPDNVYVLAELAHIYKIQSIKSRCAEHISREMDVHVNDNVQINETLVLAHKYLSDNEELDAFFRSYLPSFKEYNGFVNLDKSGVKAFMFFDESRVQEQCEEVYKWGVHQAAINENMSKEEKNELVLNQIRDLIPLINLKNMSAKFLVEFADSRERVLSAVGGNERPNIGSVRAICAVENGLISIEEAYEYLTTQVSVKSGGTSIKGSFVDFYGIHNFFQTKKINISRGHKFLMYSYPKFKIPSTPSTVQKMKGVDWYLLFDESEKLYVKHRTLVERNDYLIAEMNTVKNVNESSVDESFVLNKYSYFSVSRSE